MSTTHHIPSQPGPEHLTAGKPILCVEGDAQHLETLSQLLESHGYEVSTSTSGEACLQLIQQQAPCLIILSLELSDIDGFKVLSLIRSVPKLRDLPVIVQLSAPTRETILECKKYKVSAALSKPLQPEALIQKVREILSSIQHKAPAQQDTRRRILRDVTPLERSPVPSETGGADGNSESPKGAVPRLAGFLSERARQYDQQPVDEVVRKVAEVSTLPQIAIKVIELAEDMNTKISTLEEVIAGDPALAVRVLKTVNSAAFSLVEKLTSLHDAITYLGYHQVRNIALTASVSKIFQRDEKIGPYCRTELWRHMVCVGLAGRLLGRRLKLPDANDIFLAGLLHDIGIVLTDQHDHRNFCRMMENLDDSKTYTDFEKEFLGYDHTLLGGKVAERWRFPEFIRASIRYHHASQHYKEACARTVQCVKLANFICQLKDITSVGLKLSRPSAEVFALLGVGKEDILAVANDLDAEIELHHSYFEILRS